MDALADFWPVMIIIWIFKWHHDWRLFGILRFSVDSQVAMAALVCDYHCGILDYFSPECLLMSISLKATRAAWSAAATTLSGDPTKVYTVRLVDAPASTSSRLTPPTALMASDIASITCPQWSTILDSFTGVDMQISWGESMTMASWTDLTVSALREVGDTLDNSGHFTALLTNWLMVNWSPANAAMEGDRDADSALVFQFFFPK